jgi:hypothetical protein
MLTIGADPELFVAKDGEFVSAYGLIPGTKEEPHQVERGAVQVDGVALEFNINPASSFTEFKLNIDTVMSILKFMTKGYEFLNSTTVKVNKEKLHPAAIRLGCDPDFNAYTELMNDPPNEKLNFRSAGGHIHIGGFLRDDISEKLKYEDSIRLIRLMDKYVGVYSLLWDDDDNRRATYGKAGNCRLKEYGVEYRTLSNKWLFDPEVTKFVYDQTVEAVKALHRGEDETTQLYKIIIDNSLINHEFFRKDMTALLIKKHFEEKAQ